MRSEILGSFASRQAHANGSVSTTITEFWSADRYGRHAITRTTKWEHPAGSVEAQRIAAGIDSGKLGYTGETVDGIAALRTAWAGQLAADALNGAERIAVADAGFAPIRRMRTRSATD